MNNYNRNDRQGGNRFNNRSGAKFSGDRGFAGRDSARVTMFKAVCANCGNSCEVPFKPTGDRAVYCHDCFRDIREGGDERKVGRSEGRYSDRSDYKRDKEMFPAVCDNCGDRCEVPFQPTSGKPVYCSNCFDKVGTGRGSDGSRSGSSQDSGRILEELVKLNQKIDRLFGTFEPKVEKEIKITKEVPVQEVPVQKETIKVKVKSNKKEVKKTVAKKKVAKKKISKKNA